MLVCNRCCFLALVAVFASHTSHAAFDWSPETFDSHLLDDVSGSAGKLCLNTATQEDLDTLYGIGPSKAAAIIAFREANGPFDKLSDVDNVAGITATTISNWADNGTPAAAKCPDHDLTLSDDGLNVTHGDPNQWLTAYGSKVFSDGEGQGVFEWSVRVDGSMSNGPAVGVVGDPAVQGGGHGYTDNSDTFPWARTTASALLHCTVNCVASSDDCTASTPMSIRGHWRQEDICSSCQMTVIGADHPDCVAGDVITVRLDLNAHEVSWAVNGQWLADKATQLAPGRDWRLAVGLFSHTQSVTIQKLYNTEARQSSSLVLQEGCAAAGSPFNSWCKARQEKTV